MNVSGRVTLDPEICHGKPCIRGLRYPVENLLELLHEVFGRCASAEAALRLATKAISVNKRTRLLVFSLPCRVAPAIA